MKKSLKVIVGVVVVIAIIYIAIGREDKVPKTDEVVQVVDTKSNTVDLCFYHKSKAGASLYDVSWLKISIDGENLKGELAVIPAEKDRKVGKFEGKVGSVDKVAMARTADLWWDSMAEGMMTKEELKITFGEGDARVAYGEMVDRGDGVYVYKDTSKLTYGEPMTDTDCKDFPPKI